MTEERYEAIELILKSRDDGETWFDILFDYVAMDCQGSEDEPCTCGMEHLSGSGGTLEQCWKFLGLDDDKVTVDKEDLLLVLTACDSRKCADAHGRLLKECTWWEDWLEEMEADEEVSENEE